MSNINNYEIIIIGAGLSGLLLAYALKLKHPSASILVIEERPILVGDRTWSFYGSDLENLNFWLPIISLHWPSYEVLFSKKQRLPTHYYTIQSNDFFSKMQTILGPSLRLNEKVVKATSNQVSTESGAEYSAKLIFDTRPLKQKVLPKVPKIFGGYQKFFGLEVTLSQSHQLDCPLIMDASIKQIDGFRFFYTLPLSNNRLLLEETYYSNSSHLDTLACQAEILKYAKSKGWTIVSIDRNETGVLPIPTSTPLQNHLNETEPFQIGAGSGFYHPITGYSVLWAVKVAEAIASNPTLSPKIIATKLRRLQKQIKKNESFYLLLNRMLFYGSTETNRKNIFERFYRLPISTIERFYSGKTTIFDRIRLLIGKPPIPISAAWKAIIKPLNESALIEGEAQ